jgi:hypothetical protein
LTATATLATATLAAAARAAASATTAPPPAPPPPPPAQPAQPGAPPELAMGFVEKPPAPTVSEATRQEFTQAALAKLGEKIAKTAEK